MITIDYLRHGALEGGIKYRGLLDEKLTDEGLSSMEKVWSVVQQDVSMIIASPLSRCLEPAQAWAKQQGLHCYEEPAIQELSYGDWEGLTTIEIQQQYPGILEAWRKNPSGMTPRGGEAMDDFFQRTRLFFESLESQYDGEHILLVAHSGSIRLLLAHAMKAPIQTTRHLAMPYACWSRVQIQQGQTSLVFHNKEV